jgi:hypothetical protein
VPYYIEYFSRPDGVPLDVFHERVQAFYDGWIAAHPEDEIVLLLGRTWRLGPRPPYLCIWRFRNFARLDDWQAELKQYLSTNEGMHDDEPILVVERAGVYEDIGDEVL